MNFEPKHENKTCSACPKDQQNDLCTSEDDLKVTEEYIHNIFLVLFCFLRKILIFSIFLKKINTPLTGAPAYAPECFLWINGCSVGSLGPK